ncbi:hypothetical protein PCE1_004658 [Barthelona sp. PCE]
MGHTTKLAHLHRQIPFLLNQIKFTLTSVKKEDTEVDYETLKGLLNDVYGQLDIFKEHLDELQGECQELNLTHQNWILFERYKVFYNECSREMADYDSKYIVIVEKARLLRGHSISEEDALKKEKLALRSAIDMADDVLDAAYAGRQRIVERTERFKQLGLRLNRSIGKVPLVDNLIGKIGKRRKLNSCVCAFLIATLLFLFFIMS